MKPPTMMRLFGGIGHGKIIPVYHDKGEVTYSTGGTTERYEVVADEVAVAKHRELRHEQVGYWRIEQGPPWEFWAFARCTLWCALHVARKIPHVSGEEGRVIRISETEAPSFKECRNCGVRMMRLATDDHWCYLCSKLENPYEDNCT